ncbi:MAG: flavin-nucleotide-binding protein [Flavobacteriaceae bacterium]|nr:MAG: flavin-nucleotide-binding protein [Flavobacteriaceae bacterium]
MITEEVKKYIKSSVLCWLATSSKENIPNVSPKEVFTCFGEDALIIANIASPQTVKNIKENLNVCVSFIDVLVQKGLQIKGAAKIVKKGSPQYEEMENELIKITEGKFPFSSITKITIASIKPIIAPKYISYPETTEKEQIESALKAYKMK